MIYFMAINCSCKNRYECKLRIGNQVEYAKDISDIVVDADALLLITEWKQFRLPSWKCIKRLIQGNVIVDGCNIYDVKEMEEEYFVYSQIGK